MGKTSQLKNDCLALKKTALFFIFIGFSLGCTRANKETSQIHFTLPQTGQNTNQKIIQSPSTLTGAITWTLVDPTIFDDISCYAVFVTAPDLNKGRCIDATNAEAFQVGQISGFYPAGSEVTLEVPTGSKRTIRLIGIKASSSSLCTEGNLKNPPFTDLSAPFVLGSTIKDLAPGANAISITASLDASKKFYSCSGETSVTFGPTSVTAPPSNVTALLSGTPASSSNATALSVLVSGADVVNYKYKLGPSSATSCSTAVNYSAAFTVANSIAINLSGVADGELKLCVIGADSSGKYQSYANATSYTWNKDTTGPTVTFTAPTANSYVNATTATMFSVQGTCTDSGQMVNLMVVGGASSTTTCTSGAWSALLTTVGLGDGTITINADMTDALGNPGIQASRNFLKDTQAPTSGSLVINSGASTTTNSTVSLGMTATGATQMYVTNTAGCASGGTWEAYNTIKSGWSLAGANSNQSVYIKFQDAAGNVSTCYSDDILHNSPASLSISEANPFFYGIVPYGGVLNHTFTVTNSGGLSATSINETGLSNPFAFAGGTYPGTGGNCGAAIPPGASCTLVIGFTPISVNTFSDTIDLSYHNGVSAMNVYLNITGNGASPANLLISEASIFEFMNVPIGSSREHLFTITNNGGVSATSMSMGSPLANPYNFATTSTYPGAGGTCGSTLGAGSSCTVNVSFSPVSASQNQGEILEISYLDGLSMTGASRTLNGHGVIPFSTLALGASTTCGRDTNGSIVCWGRGTEGQLGNAMAINSLTRATVIGGPYTQISSFESTFCAINNSNYGYCWGKNTNGQVGDGTTTNVTSPTALSGTWQKISTGKTHSCGLNLSGAAKCWGDNSDGQLGDGTSTNRLSPTLVNTAAVFTDIAVGDRFTCGLVNNQTVLCWGLSDVGQVGNGTLGVYNSPTAVSGITGATSLAAGGSHACILSAGTLRCWGAGTSGQIGDGAVTNRSTPVQISDNTWISIALGAQHTCGRKIGDDTYCWGRGAEGQLGTYGNTQLSSPGFIGVFTHLFSGANHGCAFNAGGHLLCWGQNINGQLGTGTTAGSNFPIPVFP